MKPDTDKAWFRAHPGSNYRVRDPLPGEVEELADAMLPKGGEWEGGFCQPDPAPAWRVLAIKLPLGRIARVLTVAGATSDHLPGEPYFATTFVLANRLAVA